MSQILFQKTLIIGLGLIGGSFAKALRQHHLSEKIFACDPDFEAIAAAKNCGVIDEGKVDLALFEDELLSFDFIVIASPLATYETIIKKVFDCSSKTATVVDLGSVKNLNLKIQLASQRNFVPCHPIAGSEKSGFENSLADLFLHKKFIICKENADENHVKKVEVLINKIGGNVDFLESKKHDEIYGLVSHLPQFLSFLTTEFSPKNIKDEFFTAAFRLNSSNPEIWEGKFGIFTLNERNLEKFYPIFFENLAEFAQNFFDKKFSEVLKDLNFQKEKLTKNTTGEFDKKFFEENFSAIFFRALVAASYLQIPEIDSFKNYAGSGFTDFSSIVKIADFDSEKLLNLMQKNQQEILRTFDSFLG